jgi:hypothetical protein
MEVRDQYEIRSLYEEVRRQRTRLAPWDELDDDAIFALIRAYEAGARDACRAVKEPEQSSKNQQAVPDALSCPMGSTPQREALFRKMFNAVIDVLVPGDSAIEDMFKDVPQHMARMARRLDRAGSRRFLGGNAPGLYPDHGVGLRLASP